MSNTKQKENSPPRRNPWYSPSSEATTSRLDAFDKEAYNNRDSDSDIIRRISLIIDATRLTQSQFAARISYSEGYISNVMNGRFPIKERLLSKIVINFGINPSWILSGKGTMFNSDQKTINAKFNALDKDLHIEDLEFLAKLLERPFEERLIFYKFFS